MRFLGRMREGKEAVTTDRLILKDSRERPKPLCFWKRRARMGEEGPEMSVGRLPSLAQIHGAASRFWGALISLLTYNSSRDTLNCMPSFERGALTG